MRIPDYSTMGAPVTGVLKTRKGKLDTNQLLLSMNGCGYLWRIVNDRCLETRFEIEGNGSDDSWESLELVCRKVQDRVNHAMHTENPGHETDHQELGPGDGENCSAGLQLVCFICNWIKKRRKPRANNVTLKLWRVRVIGKNLMKITLHEPLRQSAEEKKRGKELRVL